MMAFQNTNPRRLMEMAIFGSAILLTCSKAFGLGSVYPNDQPVRAGDKWPQGMTDLVNTTNRVYGYQDNWESFFFFTGSAADLSSFLREYSRLEPVVKHELILHEGVPEHKSVYHWEVPAFNWHLYGVPKGVVDAFKMMEEGKGTNSNEELRRVVANTNYVLEVHFWIGGRIPLEQVVIPKDIELIKAGASTNTPTDKH